MANYSYTAALSGTKTTAITGTASTANVGVSTVTSLWSPSTSRGDISLYATVAGIASLGQVDVASGDINISYLNVTGVTTVASENVTDLNVTGVATVANLVGFSSEFSGAIGFTSASSGII